MHGGCTRPTVITPIQNHVDLDPDVNNPAITYTEEQALRRRGPLRLLARYQAYLFFPFCWDSFLEHAHWSAGHLVIAGSRSLPC